jgi:glutamine synthetase
VNSYRRFQRYHAAPINVQWGYDNRTVGLRIPSSDAENRRVENRVGGADVNPISRSRPRSRAAISA